MQNTNAFNEKFNLCIQRLHEQKKRLDTKATQIELKTAKVWAQLNGPDTGLQGKSLVAVVVGGRRFQCYRSTLTKFPGSKLEVVFSGRQKIETLNPSLVDGKEGVYFLDRDPVLFDFVMDALSDDIGEIHKVDEMSCGVSKEQIAFELDYFGIPHALEARVDAIAMNKARIVPDNKDQSSQNKSNVFVQNEVCKVLDSCLAERANALEDAETGFLTLQQRIGAEIEFVKQINQHTKDAIRISVRGEKFLITRSTLCAGGPDCMLTPMFALNSKHTVAKDDDGDPFLDRNGRRFGPILNLLRLVRDCPAIVPVCAAGTNLKGTDIPNGIQRQLSAILDRGLVRSDIEQLGVKLNDAVVGLAFQSSIVDLKMKRTLVKMFDDNLPTNFRLIHSYNSSNAETYPRNNPYVSASGPTATITFIQSTNSHVFGVFLAGTIQSQWAHAGQGSFLFGLGNITNTPMKITHNGQGYVSASSLGLCVGQSNELTVFTRGNRGNESCCAGYSAGGYDWSVLAPGYGSVTKQQGMLCGTPGSPSYIPMRVEVFAVTWKGTRAEGNTKIRK